MSEDLPQYSIEWNNQAPVPETAAVLEEGIEWTPMTMSAVDADIVEQYGLQIEDIMRAYRVPLSMLGSRARDPRVGPRGQAGRMPATINQDL